MAGPVDAMPPLPGYLDNRMPQLMTMPLTLPKRLSTPLLCLPRSLYHLFVGLPVALSGWVFRYGLTHSGMSYWLYPKILPCHWYMYVGRFGLVLPHGCGVFLLTEALQLQLD